jgi:hypothetical protein
MELKQLTARLMPFAFSLYFTAAMSAFLWIIYNYYILDGRFLAIGAIGLLYCGLTLASFLNLSKGNLLFSGSAVDVLSVPTQKAIRLSGILLALPALALVVSFFLVCKAYIGTHASTMMVMRFQQVELFAFNNSRICDFVTNLKRRDLSDAWCREATALAARGQMQEAARAFGEAFLADQENPVVPAHMVRIWETLVACDPNSPRHHYGLGRALMYAGDFDEATKELNLAIAMSSNQSYPAATRCLKRMPARMVYYYHLKGYRLHVDEGRIEAAISMYNKALSVDPKEDSVLYSLGVANHCRGHVRTALDYFEKALALKPSHDLYKNVVAELRPWVEKHGDYYQPWVRCPRLLSGGGESQPSKLN